MDRKTDEDGVNWISCDVLVVGDYGGAGALGEANIRSLQEHFGEEACNEDWSGGYGHRQLWLVENADTLEVIRGLEQDYPLFSEEMESRVQMEWEEEAWKDWLKGELLATLPDALQEICDLLPDEELFEMYRSAMESANEYVVFEHSGCFVHTDRIQGAFQEALTAHLREALDVLPVSPTTFDGPADWLIAADWCEDHDRPELALYVRWLVTPEPEEVEG